MLVNQIEEFFCMVCGVKKAFDEYGTEDVVTHQPICTRCYEKRMDDKM